MRTPERKATAVVFLALALIAASCRQGTSNLTPAQQTQVNLYVTLDVITSANKTVASSMVALNAQGTVNTETARAVLGWSQTVNDSSRAALAILDSTQTPAQKSQAVLDVLKKLDLPPTVKAFVDSNPNVSAVIEVIRSIVRIQQSITKVTATPPALLSTEKPARMVGSTGDVPFFATGKVTP